MNRGWICGWVAFAILVCGAPVATGAVPGDGPYRVQMVYRTGKSLAPFELTIAASADNDFGMWFAVELTRVKDRWLERTGTGFGGYREIAPSATPAAYGHPAASALPRCPDTPGCTVPVPFDGSQRFTTKPTATSRYYVVSAHADVRIELSSRAWRVKDVPGPGFRRTFGHRADAVGVRTLSLTAERFTSAAAVGGRYGSSVFAYVPCERGGHGRATLTGRGADTGGGIPPQPLRCGATSAYYYEYAYSPHQTTWRLQGDVVGVGSLVARLVVFDFPKP